MSSIDAKFTRFCKAVLKQLIVDSTRVEFHSEIKEQLRNEEYTEYWKELCEFAEINPVEFFRVLITNVGEE